MKQNSESNASTRLFKYITSLGDHINILNERLKEIEEKMENISKNIEDLKSTAIIAEDIKLPKIIVDSDNTKVRDKDWLK